MERANSFTQVIILFCLFFGLWSCQKGGPTASFTVNPESGTTNTLFSFDPSTCTDDQTAYGDLLGKWDWEGDGIYDNELQNLEIVTHRFTEAGTYNPTLWIEDVDGNNDHSSISIVVEQREELRQTIGEEGGVMQYKDLELLISPQTFDKGEDLSISIFESQSDFFICDPDASIFQVEGLPDNISAPIHIHFDVSTFPEKQDIELVIGQIGVLKTLDRLEICSVPIETVREGDILVGYIQPEDLGTQGLRSKTSSQTGTLWMSIISNRATFSSPLFKIKYDYKEISNSTLISNLHSYFVDAYNVIQNEFNLSWDGRTTWPIIIDVKPMDQEIDGEMVRPKMSWNVNKYYININSLIVNDESLCKSSSQHELFHLTQELYNNQHKKDHYWFDEAASTWSQDFGAPGSTNNSLDILVKQEPFYGMNNTAHSGYQKHGYGMAYIVKYIADIYGNGVVRSIYDEINSGANIIQVIFNQFAGNQSDWFVDFMDSYLTGGIYGDLGYEIEDLGYAEEFAFDKPSDTVKIMEGEANDLGVDLIQFNLSEDYDPESILHLELSGLTGFGQMRAYRFKRGGGQYLELLSYSADQIILSNLNSLKDQGYKIMLAIFNSRAIPPYQDKASYTINITKSKQEKTYNFGDVDYVDVILTYTGDYEGFNDDPYTSYEGVMGFGYEKKNMFQASQYIEFDFKISDGDINPSYITYAGYIRLDTANLRIENMKIEATTYDENSNLDEDWSGRVWSMELEDLPFSFPEPHLAEFEAEDSDVSNKVVNLTEIIRYDGYLDFETGGFEKCSQTLKSYSFESNGLLNVLVVIRSD